MNPSASQAQQGPRSPAEGAAASPAAPSAELRRLGELIVGWRGAHAVFAAASLGLFEAVEGGRSAPEAARLAGTDPRSTEILLDALCALGFLEKKEGRYDNTPSGRDLLLPTGPRSLRSNLRYQQLLAPAWAELDEAVRRGRPPRGLRELLSGRPEFAEAYIGGMQEIARGPARELADRLELAESGRLLDLGGGPGAYVRAFLDRSPGWRAVILDLPESLRTARRFFEGWAGADRVELREGDYHRDEPEPGAFDLVLLSHVTHDEAEDSVRELLGRARRALRPGGAVVVHDFMTDAERTSPLFAALFSVHMLTYTEGGRTYSGSEYSAWLSEAGFGSPRRLELGAGSVNASVALVAARP